MTSDSTAAAPRILLADDSEPADGEPIDGQPAEDPPDAPPEDPDAQPLPRPLLIDWAGDRR